MVTIAHLVKNNIKDKPYLQEALSRGIVNHAALSEEMIPFLQKELGKTVKFSSVNMAIRRYAENLKKQKIENIKFDKNSDILIRSDMIEVIVYRNENIQDSIDKLNKAVDYKTGNFLTITQGLNEILIITNKKYHSKITDIFPKSSIKKTIKNLCSLTINIPEKSVKTVGLFYLVTRSLSWENVNIIDIVSTYTELTVVIDENDVSKSFNVLKNLIKNNSKL